MPFARPHIVRTLAAFIVLAAFHPPAAGDTLPSRLDAALAPLAAVSRTGVIYDRVLPLAHLERLDGSASAPAIDRATWLQAYDELRRAATTPSGPDVATLEAQARTSARAGTILLALIDRAYERLREGALSDGSLAFEGDRVVRVTGTPLVQARAVAAAALVPRIYHGGHLRFALDPSRVFTDGAAPRTIAIDFGDGTGFRGIALGEPVEVAYATTGRHVVRLELTRADGTTAEASFTLDVAALAAPPPNDTLHVTATTPYQGAFGTGDAYVYLAPGHTSIVNPIVVIEGFDLDNSMNWDELYALLNVENLLESMRAEGFDAVVLNFTDATAPIQQNAFVVAELIQEVQASIAPNATLALVGASMGGLCSRYALAWMETHGVPHRVRTWISFDGPHGGADIPLGLQYWIHFFAGQSSDAASFLAILNRPAARQMLLYHYTDPPTAAAPDPMRASLLADFAAVGDYPTLTRRIAVSNGSGSRANQGFGPNEQVIRWQYNSTFFAVTGNVWAVPDHVSSRIFQGSTRVVFSTTSQNVSASGTWPLDGAPGGSRASFAELDATSAPYGDIVALYPAHCFIPTVSALALATDDPFYDVAGDPALLSHTPFDALYFENGNQPHVMITPGNGAFVKDEIEQTLLASVPASGAPGAALRLAAFPNPFRGASAFQFALAAPARVALRVFAVDGREVRTLLAGAREAGSQAVSWDGRDSRGARVPAGVYFVRLEAGDRAATLRTIKLD